VIAGEGPIREELRERGARHSFIHFLPLQPAEALSALLNMADVHVLPQQAGAADLVLPSKLGGMLASGKPIIAMADEGTEIHDLLKDVALLIPSGDSAGLAVAMREAKAMDFGVRIARGLQLAAEMTPEEILPRFETLLRGARFVSARPIEHQQEVLIENP
jgi:colanic acid biosynthesis glycosyl transferase WcaI